MRGCMKRNKLNFQFVVRRISLLETYSTWSCTSVGFMHKIVLCGKKDNFAHKTHTCIPDYDHKFFIQKAYLKATVSSARLLLVHLAIPHHPPELNLSPLIPL